MIKIDDSGVGSPYLIDGDNELGFFGEVEAEDLIWGKSLAALLELEAGEMLYDNQPWLKFIDKGVIKFVAKKPIKYNISWDQINELNLVYGEVQVVIKGYRYIVRLFQGAQDEPTHWNPTAPNAQYDWLNTHRSEWNRLMYPIHESTPPSQHIPNFEPPEFDLSDLDPNAYRLVYTRKMITPGEELYLANYMTEYELYKYKASLWRPYTNLELNVADNFGRNTWCQETWAYNEDFRLQRGCDAVEFVTIRKRWEINQSYGWRPILELIGKEEE